MRSDELLAKVWEALQSEESPQADEFEYDQLFVDLEWLLTLEAGGRFHGWNLPSVAELDPVIETWLAAWSEYFDGLSGPEFKAKRREVIEETFTRFRALCESWEQKRA